MDPSGFVAPGNNKLGKAAFLSTSEPSETRFPLRWHRHSSDASFRNCSSPGSRAAGCGGSCSANSNRFRLACREPAVWDDFHAKGLEVDIPGVDDRIEEGDAVFNRDVEDVRVQKLENGNAHLLVAAAAELGHQAQPLFILQFLFGNSLGDIQKFLSDQAFEFAERLPSQKSGALLFAGRDRICAESTRDTL